jgi:hypothetical protein
LVRKELEVVLAVGLMSVAVALAARQVVPALAPAPLARPATATATAAATAAATATATAAAPAPAAPTGAGEEQSDFELWGEEGGASDSGSSARLGGWERGAPLPLCGREGGVRLRDSPGGSAGSGSLPSCEEEYGEYPQVSNMVPITAREGSWVKVPDGWANVDEVRTAEILIIDGREFWHSLFKASVAEVKGRRVVLEGDADPCASEVCGSAHGEWEQAEMIRERYAAEHPGGVPPEASARMQAEIEAIGQASEAATKEAEEQAANREKQRRVLELAAPPPSGGGAPRVEGGQYLCCT